MSPHSIDDVMEWFGESVLPGNEMLSQARITWANAALLYGGALSAFFLFCFALRVRGSPRKPMLTSFLDTLLYVPYLLRIGPWARENDIEEALKSAMTETKLLDFGLEDDDLRGSNGVRMFQVFL